MVSMFSSIQNLQLRLPVLSTEASTASNEKQLQEVHNLVPNTFADTNITGLSSVKQNISSQPMKQAQENPQSKIQNVPESKVSWKTFRFQITFQLYIFRLRLPYHQIHADILKVQEMPKYEMVPIILDKKYLLLFSRCYTQDFLKHKKGLSLTYISLTHTNI